MARTGNRRAQLFFGDVAAHGATKTRAGNEQAAPPARTQLAEVSNDPPVTGGAIQCQRVLLCEKIVECAEPMMHTGRV